MSFAAITLCVASERVIPKLSVYFFIDSVRKLLDTPSYIFHARFEVFTAIKIQNVLWVVTLGSNMVELISYHITTRCHNPEDHDLNLSLQAYILRKVFVCCVFITRGE
jgi:hypothetical protein